MLIKVKNYGAVKVFSMSQTWDLFVFFAFFSQYNDKYSKWINLNGEGTHGVIEIWTWDCRIICTDESTELWWLHSALSFIYITVTCLKCEMTDLFYFFRSYLKVNSIWQQINAKNYPYTLVPAMGFALITSWTWVFFNNHKNKAPAL